ncbi:Transcription factor cys6 [Neofusicoccum parvum]|nr:Transcription factor cys6 [Neofusicoccum parvum]
MLKISSSYPCHYEVHVKTAKEEMVRRIKSLEQQNAELQGSVKERDYQIEAIFEALKTGERGSEAIARLRSGQSYQEIVTWLGGPPVGDVGRLSPGSETRLADIVQDYDDSMRMDMGSQSPEAETRARWTFASPQLTDHLVALFFTWVHPIHMLFSEYYFMKSFSDGDRSIHYHVAMCQLFRPVLEVVQLPETTRAHLYKITIQSALDGLQLLERYRSLYTNKYQNPLLAFCVVHICDLLVLAGGAKDVQQRAAQFALEATHESLAGFAYVGPLQYMFAKSIADEGVSLPEDVEELMGGRTRYGPEEMLDACERVTYTQPYKMLRDRMDRSLGVDFEREWKLFMETQGAGRSQWAGGTSLHEAGLVARRSDSNSSSASGGSSARSMQIHSVVNP